MQKDALCKSQPSISDQYICPWWSFFLDECHEKKSKDKEKKTKFSKARI